MPSSLVVFNRLGKLGLFGGARMDLPVITNAIKEILSTATAVLASADQALKLGKGIRDLIKPAESTVPQGLKDQVVDLLEQLVTLRHQNLLMMDALLQAQRALKQRDEFVAEKVNYALKELAPNSLAYVLKEPQSEEDKLVKLCPHCFGENKKSLLQHEKTDWGFDTLVCRTCGTRSRTPNGIEPTVHVAPTTKRRSRWFDEYD